MATKDQRVAMLMGEAALKLGCLHEARDAFQTVLGRKLTKEQLLDIGFKCIMKGQFGDAIEAYTEAGYPKGLIAIAYRCLEQGFLDDAFAAFKAAEDRPGLITLGFRLLKEDRAPDARAAFEAAVNLEAE